MSLPSLASSSSTTFGGTIQPGNNAVLGPPAPPLAHLRIDSPPAFGRDCIRVGSGVSGVKIRNLDIETQGNKLASAVTAYGTGTEITTLRSTGTGKAIRTGGEQAGDRGTIGGFADLVYCDSAMEYCFWSGGEDPKTHDRIWTDGFNWRRFDIINANVPSAVHAARHEHTKDCVWGDANLSLPGFEKGGPGPKLPAPTRDKGFAFRVRRAPGVTGKFNGPFTALAINDSENAHVQRGLIDFMALGPLHIWAAPHPGWRANKPMVEDSDIKTLIVNLGTVDFVFRNCVIAYASLTGERQNYPTFPDPTGVFQNCLFMTKPPMSAGVKYVNCMWAGRAVGSHGEA